jgi:ribonuclease Z
VRHGKGAYGFVIKENDRIKFNAEKAHGLGMKGKMFREIQEKGFVVVNSRKITLEEVSFLKPGVKIVYSGDCAPSKKLLEYAKDADLLIHEATFGSEHAEEAVERLHSTVVDAAHIAKDANVKQLIVTHISPRYEKEEKRKRLLEEARAIFNNTILAYDGLRLVIK